MSTSYKSLFPSTPPSPIEVFSYPEAAGQGQGPVAPADSAADKVVNGDSDEMAQLLLRAHAEGVREGEEREQARCRLQLEQMRATITEAILRFQTEVAEYFSRTEGEVVQLVLGIARKIMRRESQADPMLLARVARSVLDQLHQNTNVRVRVHPHLVENWRGELAPHHDGKIAIEVLGDESVDPENCVLETLLGTTEIGLEAQLNELNTGLFDLLAQAPEPQAQ
jgi:flagellar biosynthesis/type III secretory pathway protein FliH